MATLGSCSCYFPRRYIHVILCSLGMLLIHAMRVNVAVAVITILDKAPHKKVGTMEAALNLPNVAWDSRKIGLLHSVFYLGYLVSQIPGSYLTTVFPSHRLFGGSILISCSLNLLLPLSISKIGYEMTCIIRVLQGLSEGLLFPSCYSVMRHWCPPEETSRMGAIVLAGVYFGPVIGLIASGAITHYIGWNYVFHVHGATGIFWYLFWLFLSYEDPKSHPTIREEEQKYILQQQGESAISHKNVKVPWRAILTSVPVMSLVVCDFARSTAVYLMLTNEPAYLNIFNWNIAENGFLSSLPHALKAVVALCSGPVADYMIKDPLLSRTNVRKIFTCIGFGVESLCFYMLGVSRLGEHALIFLTLGLGMNGLTISGWHINHLDLAPRFASVLVAITTTVGTTSGIITPLVVGELTQDQSIRSWQHVFLISATVILIAAIVYAIFGSGEKQPWAEVTPEIKLVDMVNPLEKSPYGTFRIQKIGRHHSSHDDSTDEDQIHDTAGSQQKLVPDSTKVSSLEKQDAANMKETNSPTDADNEDSSLEDSRQ